MNVELLENERIDDLERNGLKIIQNEKLFCFGMDAVLLSGFLAVQKGESVIDLGTGTGILPLLIYAKTQAESITGLEIQDISFDMARRSIALNSLEDKIKIVHGDIKEAVSLFGKSVFDVVTCNPPYIKADSGIVNPGSHKAIARHEVLCTFDDVAKQSASLLKPGGRLYLVHRPERLTEIFETLKKYRLEPKRMKTVHSFKDTTATMVLIEAVLGGRMQMTIEKPLIIYKEKNVYTDEIYEIYGF